MHACTSSPAHGVVIRLKFCTGLSANEATMSQFLVDYSIQLGTYEFLEDYIYSEESEGIFFWFTPDEYVQWRVDHYNVPVYFALREFQCLCDVHILLHMEEDGVKYFFIVKYDVEQYFGIGLVE